MIITVITIALVVFVGLAFAMFLLLPSRSASTADCDLVVYGVIDTPVHKKILTKITSTSAGGIPLI